MADSKDKPKKAKEKKPSPFRNGLIMGLLIGGFIGLLINTPSFMAPIKDPIVGIFKAQVDEGRKTVGAGMKAGGKALTETGEEVEKGDEPPAGK